MEKEYYTWENFNNGILSISRQCVLDNFIPDIVVGIQRGGLIPAVQLSHYFNCPMGSVDLSLRDKKTTYNYDDQQIAKQIFMYQNHYNRILLVDDICDSGATLDTLFKTEISSGLPLSLGLYERIKTAVLHNNIGQDLFNVDYYHKEINKLENDIWLVYPWEY